MRKPLDGLRADSDSSDLLLFSTRFLRISCANNFIEQAGVQCLYCPRRGEKRDERMLWTIFVVLLLLWVVGLVSSYTFGGLIYLLLVAALVVLLIQLISGRRHVV